MKRLQRCAALAALMLALSPAGRAQNAPEPDDAPAPPADTRPSALGGELFYQLLVGELSARDGDTGTAFSLLLDAARKTSDAALFQRAIEVAFQSRSGEAALQAARAWRRALPQSRDATRYQLQILLFLNRVTDSGDALKAHLALAEPKDRDATFGAILRIYSRVTDKRLAARVVEQALADYLNAPASAAGAWTAVGRMRLAASDLAGALEAARKAQAANPAAEFAAVLALELVEARQAQAEPLVLRYLETPGAAPEVRMAFARSLLDTQRYAEAAGQLSLVTAQKPDYPEAWLVLGTLQVQDNQPAAAQASLERYVALASAQPASDERARGLSQAYLSLSQLAQQRKAFDQAQQWLDKIENPQDLMAAQSRRASLLASQGKLAEARAVIQQLPARTPADQRAKLLAEVSLLRDQRMFKQAFDLLASAPPADPPDVDLLYEQAMLAEKLENLAEMERLLRLVTAIQPDYHHAYNALGYSLAERGLRLPEARLLILKALEYAPNDPFINDSLGWVEFRLGNRAEAQRILEAAFKTRPDAEIAAHLGEVLWASGLKDRALAVWREGLSLNADNETLRETLKRLQAKP